MQFFTALLLVISLALQCDPIFGQQKKIERLGIKPTLGSPDRTPIKTLPLTSRQNVSRTKRSAGHIISDCTHVTSEEGRFFYKTLQSSDQVCGVYFLTDPDKIVEVHFEYFDVPCEDGGLVAFVDGWELSGQYFPSLQDHKKPLEERFHEFCGVKRIKKLLITSQNAGLIQYRIPKRGNGFSFVVRHLKTPNPCNIVTEGKTDVYTLRNYGKAVNCSLSGPFPAKVKVLALNVGMVSPLMSAEMETGTIHKCEKRGMKDLVQIGGSQGLDNSKLVVAEDICGIDSKPQAHDATIFCDATTVRLVSSGEFDNSVTFVIRLAGAEDILEPDLVCEL